MRFQATEDGPWEAAVVGQGFCEIANNRVMLLADTIEKPEEIDRIRAQEALERAKERLRQKQSISPALTATISLSWCAMTAISPSTAGTIEDVVAKAKALEKQEA